MRRNLEKAKLQDQNVALSEKANRQQASLDSYLRFNARAVSFREQLSNELKISQQELRQLKSTHEETLSELAKKNSLLKETTVENIRLKEQIVANEKIHKIENSELRHQFNEQTKHLEVAERKARNNIQSTRTQEHEIIQMTAAMNTLQQQLNDVIGEQKETNKRNANLANQLETTREIANNLNREIKIKDKQIEHLRSQLEDCKTGSASFLSLATMGTSGDNAAQQELIEILEDDIKMMKTAYEKKVEDLEMEIERLKSLSRNRR